MGGTYQRSTRSTRSIEVRPANQDPHPAHRSICSPSFEAHNEACTAYYICKESRIPNESFLKGRPPPIRIAS